MRDLCPTRTFLYVLFYILLFNSCSDEIEPFDQSSNGEFTAIPDDEELVDLLVDVSNGLGHSFFILPNETDYASIPQDPKNPITAAKVALGQLLVHETATGGAPKVESAIYTYSCSSCHPVASGFYSGLRQGIGEGGMGFGFSGDGRVVMPESVFPRDSLDVLPIKVPTILNVAYQEVMLWNGALGGTGINAPFINTGTNAEDLPDNLLGFEGLEVQGMAGQLVHRLKIDEEFVDQFGYRAMFDAAFPEISENERYSRLTGALAIAAFNRTVLSNQSPWQNWLKGNDDAMTDNQVSGAKVFFDKGKCYQCHTGPALKSNEFHAFGMGDFDPRETIILDRRGFKKDVTRGRGAFTEREEDEFKFKVPTLYNLRDNPSYGHGGTFTSVRQVIEYKNNGRKQNERVPDTQLADQFGNLDLTETEISQLVDFVENGLYDPNLIRYVPEEVLSGNCIPNNDTQSKLDLGCED
ncbi:cytochrome-c peroxidase [Croceitalea rosinachiae]|uniref:Cytochrome c peroxidase n=1 Tax=Croceitalea rosinachiae TaxID=3075596 RepID=A0ABU3A6C8_9FLAO|nr:cytochrome c peroxidase [Croceitalea sp. F388]MDT0605448.1 cytochrome c peroxidase [Croceitalea sp. F388]